ncbi:glutamate--cysteine ligase regulatory subunit [Orussus abietinus]|uniref:glutamate--cysteine ligase regulatory subunit n=1 Tax=Orussus abietinus TaxID=222816 RepID=UPI0006268B04|nr:glutamate--cysteine ligase regulatory subunit [Orussus abietinus]
MLSHNLLIGTGNILAFNELKKEAGLNPRDELIEALKITLQNSECKEDASIVVNGKEETNEEEVGRRNLKIIIKVFISSPKADSLKEALDQVFKALHTDTIESLVIAYGKTESDEDLLTSLKSLWTVIEEYCRMGKLSSVGVSNVSTDVFYQLFEWANVKPNIIQINLTTSCVVPHGLQVFTKENDVQLLTHNDPCQILPKEALNEVFGSDVNLHWVARYHIHLKCRGVLASKGYLVYINKPSVTPT